jgi:hypothetical protein
VVVAERKRRQVGVPLFVSFAVAWLVTGWVFIRRHRQASLSTDAPLPDHPTCKSQTMSATQVDVTDVVLAEFAALRAEILQTLSQQWLILAFDLTAAGAIFSLALSSHNTRILLILPVVTYSLIDQYLKNFKMLMRLGDYIKDTLSPNVDYYLGWEKWLKPKLAPPRKQGRIKRLSGSLSHLPAIFLLTSIVALVWVAIYLSNPHILSISSRILFGVIWIVCLMLTTSSVISVLRVWKDLYSKQVPADEGNSVPPATPSS